MGQARGISTPQQPTRRTTQTTENYRKLPEITGSSDFSDTMDPFEESGNPSPTLIPPPSFPRKRESRDGPGAGHSRTRHTTQTTEKYRKLPETTGSSDFSPLSQYKIEQVTK